MDEIYKLYEKAKEPKALANGCVYNREGVVCTLTVKPCYKCGWNPKVSKDRICKIKEELRKEQEDVR